MVFVARKDELRTLGDLIRAAADGRGGALVVAGEAGIGKSALIDTTVGGLDGWLVLRASGTEFEQDLPYASLHQLCAPVITYRDGLPAVQRQALESVFGLCGGTAPDPLTINLAVLGLLHEAARAQAVCCAVDDVQWADVETRRVLGFVARRVTAVRIAVVLAERAPSIGPGLSGLSRLTLRGLHDAEARELLRSAAHTDLDGEVIERVLAEAGGNPLALLELGHRTGPLGLPGGRDDGPRGTVVDALEDRYTRLVRALPPAARSLMVLAAAEPVGDFGLVGRAARLLALDPAELTAAEDEGLISLGPRLRFRHPLVRSGAYRSATPGTRRRVHAALAEATDAKADPDRRAWHRAHSVIDTDEDVAAELVGSAGRAQRRSGLSAAAAFLERAAQLSPDPARQGERLLAAARARLNSGAPAQARELLAQAERRPLAPADRADAQLQQALIEFHVARSADATVALVDAAAGLPADRAREAYLEAFSSSMFVVRLPGRLRQLGVRIREQVPHRGGAPRPVDLLLDALLDQVLEPVEDAVPTMRRAVAAFRTATSPWWMELACLMALDLGDDESAQALSVRQVKLAREQGAFTLMPQALRVRAITLTVFGRPEEAAACLEEALAIDEATGTVSLSFAELILAGWRGDADRVRELRATMPGRVGRDEVVAELYTTAVLCNGLADYPAALKAGLASRKQERDGAYVVWSLDQEFVEAAVRGGQPEECTAVIARLEALARTGRTPWAQARHRLAQALLDPAAESTDACYCEAIDLLARTEVRGYYGRARLMYGEWLRRVGRRGDARVELQAAHETLTGAGATAFAERAARELEATGQRPRRDETNALELLTAQERLIVGKVVGGATSKEVAAALFLSPRTIDTHLRNTYRKLGISSRRELRQLLR
ncbi:AAA family ATPase [Streptomyces sp. NPDC020681]|uniref:AAA family ATPase n=1 Tax=Streptomyces sp. NPDC020681 TaxID=3365083 RepID=UPI003790C76B